MKQIITIIKKELSRIFGDKRLLFNTIILPGLMIFIMYSFIGEAMMSALKSEEDEYNVILINEVKDFTKILNEMDIELNYVFGNVSEIETYKEKLINEEVDLIILFEDDFENEVISLQKPNVNIYYNPSNDLSSSVYSFTLQALTMLESMYLQSAEIDPEMFTINKDNHNFEVYDDTKFTGKMFSMLLPFLIITFLFSGAMGVAPESIAGDKERGTMATLLVTPIKRSYIAVGKITALSIIAILNAISSFVGIIASIPKLMEGAENIDATIYGFGDYLIILFILIATVLLMISIISTVSAFANNLKESSSFVLPLYFISMALGIASMFSDGASTNPLVYVIPLYNSLQSFVSVFSFNINIINILICIISNIIYTGILIFVLSKMFNSEKIMFSK